MAINLIPYMDERTWITYKQSDNHIIRDHVHTNQMKFWINTHNIQFFQPPWSVTRDNYHLLGYLDVVIPRSITINQY